MFRYLNRLHSFHHREARTNLFILFLPCLCGVRGKSEIKYTCRFCNVSRTGYHSVVETVFENAMSPICFLRRESICLSVSLSPSDFNLILGKYIRRRALRRETQSYRESMRRFLFFNLCIQHIYIFIHAATGSFKALKSIAKDYY